MSSNSIKKIINIENMTCVNCENIIEQTLIKEPGILHVSASYSSGTAEVTYDDNIIKLTRIVEILLATGYHVREENLEKIDTGENFTSQNNSHSGQLNKNRKDYSNIAGTAIILLAIYIIASRLGVFSLFNNFPLAKEGMGYGMLFSIGILTSIHCVAMCGGICLSQCVPAKAGSKVFSGKLSAMQPSLLYNLGRVISYTIIGGTVGALGSVVSFSGTAKGIVQLLAGIFMVIMGLNMLNIFPWLRKFNPRMPKIFAKKIYTQKASKSPFYIGLLNGLMPCGPLQAMQLYALSTGSPVKGALSMFLFSAGTVPLMFAFGALSSLLSKKFTGRMMKVSAALVVILGVFMLNNGMSLAGITMPDFRLSKSTISETASATLQDGVQVVTTELSSGRYEPIVVQKGIPVKWTIKAAKGSINGCNYSIVIPEYGLQRDLVEGDNIIQFTPDKSGTFSYSCWMGMIRSKITVVDDLNKIDSSALKEDNAVTSGGGSCCAGGTGASAGNNGTATSGAIDYDKLKNAKVQADTLAVAKLKDGVQYVDITYDEKGFSPAVVVMQSGIKTNWVINGKEGLSSLIFPDYNAKLEVLEGENPIDFTPQRDFSFFTEDSSYLGYVKVVDNITDINEEAIKEEAANYNPFNINY